MSSKNITLSCSSAFNLFFAPVTDGQTVRVYTVWRQNTQNWEQTPQINYLHTRKNEFNFLRATDAANPSNGLALLSPKSTGHQNTKFLFLNQTVRVLMESWRHFWECQETSGFCETRGTFGRFFQSCLKPFQAFDVEPCCGVSQWW